MSQDFASLAEPSADPFAALAEPSPTAAPTATGHPQARATAPPSPSPTPTPQPSPTPSPGALHDLHQRITAPAVDTSSREASLKALQHNAQHQRPSLLDQYEDYTDLQWVISGAMGRDLDSGTLGSGTHLKKAMALFKKDPHAANMEYGLNAKGQLTWMAAHGNPIERREAAFLLQHPWAVGAETFAEEFFNLPQMALGGAAFKLGAKMLSMGSHLPAARYLLNLTSPFADMVKEGGDEAKHAVAAWVNKVRESRRINREVGQSIAGGLSPEEQFDVMRRSEAPGQGPHSGVGILGHRPDLDARAKAYRDFIKRKTAEHSRKRIGLVKQPPLAAANVYDPDRYHPMKGAYRNPQYAPEDVDYVEGLKPHGTGIQPIGKQGEKVIHGGIDESLGRMADVPVKEHAPRGPGAPATQPLSLLSPEFSLAKQIEDFGHRVDRNVLFEEGLASLPRSLIQVTKDVHPIEHAPLTTNGRPMIRADTVFGSSGPGQAAHASPTLRSEHVWIAPSLKNWLLDHGYRSFGGERMPLDNKYAEGALRGWESFNDAFRTALVTNRLVHPFWNLATNSSALARRGLGGLMLEYARAMANTATAVPDFFNVFKDTMGPPPEELVQSVRKGLGGALARSSSAPLHDLGDRLLHGAQDYADAMAEAIGAGAGSGISGGTGSALWSDRARILGARYRDLGAKDRVDKFLTQLGEWNRRGVFGPSGEQDIQGRLYASLAKSFPNASAHERAYMVREALGNYANTKSGSLAHQLLFFYPFLKTNAPFWTRTFLTAPRYVAAPHEASRRVSENFARPGETKPRDFRSQIGDWMYTPLLPQRILEQESEMISPSQGSELDTVTPRLQAAERVVSGRLQPVPGAIMDTLSTMYGESEDPSSPWGFHTVYEKNAPGDVKARQVGAYATGHFAPLPGGGTYMAQDLLREGVSPESIASGAFSMTGLGALYHRMTPVEQRQLGRANAAFDTKMRKLQTRLKKGAITPSESEKQQRRLYDIRNKRVNSLLHKVQSRPTPEPTATTDDFSALADPSPDPFAALAEPSSSP